MSQVTELKQVLGPITEEALRQVQVSEAINAGIFAVLFVAVILLWFKATRTIKAKIEESDEYETVYWIVTIFAVIFGTGFFVGCGLSVANIVAPIPHLLRLVSF